MIKTLDLEIEDKGAGISEEKLNEIFSDYDSDNKNFKNTHFSLGLTISQNLVKALNNNRPGTEIKRT